LRRQEVITNEKVVFPETEQFLEQIVPNESASAPQFQTMKDNREGAAIREEEIAQRIRFESEQSEQRVSDFALSPASAMLEAEERLENAPRGRADLAYNELKKEDVQLTADPVIDSDFSVAMSDAEVVGFIAVEPARAVAMTGAEEGQPTSFMQTMAGDWQGRAITSPAGAMDYDLNFTRTSRDCVSASVNTGASDHVWTFCRSDGLLQLELQSDFLDDETPIQFKLLSRQQDDFIFRADSHEFMELVISLNRDNGRIRVLHDDELHVDIELTRN